MKKLVSLSLTILLAIGLFSACGCAKKDDNAQGSAAPSQSAASDAAQSPESAPSESTAPENGSDSKPDSSAPAENTDAAPELPAVSENKEVVQESNAPKVLMIKNAESNIDKLTYHLEGCKLLKGKETNEVSWEYIKTVGFWQCPECNPPRYEDYANAQ